MSLEEKGQKSQSISMRASNADSFVVDSFIDQKKAYVWDKDGEIMCVLIIGDVKVRIRLFSISSLLNELLNRLSAWK